MIDQQRLLHVTDDDFERRILSAAAGDLASDESLQRTLVAMGAVAAKGAAATVAGTAATASLRGAKAGWGLGALAKGKVLTAFALGSLAGTAVTAGAEAVLWPRQTRPSSADVHVVEHPRVIASPPAPRAARREPEVSAVEAPSPSRGPSAMRFRSASVPLGDQTRASPIEMPASGLAIRAEVTGSASSNPGFGDAPPEGSSLPSELAALVRVRAALARHDAASALGLLAEYDRRFPSGALGPEAMVLRIEALFEGGERSRAVEAATRFLASHPGSPHEARLRTLMVQGRIR